MRKNNNAKQEFRDLRLRLKAISCREDYSLLSRFNESITLINAFLAVVRERVTTVAFKDQPEYYSLKIYELSLYGILNQRPVGTDEMLRDYILGELRVLEERAISSGVGMNGDKKWFDWTGEVINLVELGYAIYLSRQLGKDKSSLTEIFHWLEVSFGLEIGIPANRFREIKRRKRLSRTHFLDHMYKVCWIIWMGKMSCRRCIGHFLWF